MRPELACFFTRVSNNREISPIFLRFSVLSLTQTSFKELKGLCTSDLNTMIMSFFDLHDQSL